jgi:hypothetical protein
VRIGQLERGRRPVGQVRANDMAGCSAGVRLAERELPGLGALRDESRDVGTPVLESQAESG